MLNKRFRWATVSVCLLFTAFVSSVAYAGQGFYVTDQSARTGMIMSLTKNQEIVEPSSLETQSAMVGVLDDSEQDIHTQPGQINVQTDGVSAVLVSTVNGDIKVGDRIGASSIVGIGAKLAGASGWIVGVAQGSLDASSEGALKSSVLDSAGNNREVYVGSIPLLISVTYYNAQQSDSSSSSLLNRLQEMLQGVAGRRASQTAIFLSFLILISGIVIASVIANTAVRNGIQSTARQPLAKQAVMRRMFQASLAAFGILAVAIVGALIVVRVL